MNKQKNDRFLRVEAIRTIAQFLCPEPSAHLSQDIVVHSHAFASQGCVGSKPGNIGSERRDERQEIDCRDRFVEVQGAPVIGISVLTVRYAVPISAIMQWIFVRARIEVSIRENCERIHH
ncbi:hypothetical protein [Burkholderia cenocepacia]|uniref:hypothetical protein n=1 Tax=Burkholderia cenocepacia TaxID=95486 RepID=UPI001178A936|nr:hypothetical protein [Burkholderia cenocepacia]